VNEPPEPAANPGVGPLDVGALGLALADLAG